MTKPSPSYSFGSYIAVGPSGTSCAMVNQFVVVGSAYDVQWSAIGDPTDWPTPATDDARAKQAGLQTMPPEFGYVTGIAGNDFFGYVFQERGITKMTYVGSDVVFSFDTFEEDRGCEAYGMLVQVDDKVFFKSDRGYHLLENDQIVDIGYGVIDESYS